MRSVGLGLLALLLTGTAVACNGDEHGDKPRSSSGNVVGATPDAGRTPDIPGSTPLNCPDRDGDGIADDAEGMSDADGDGHGNADDTDSDGDGADDAIERGASPCLAPSDSDRDGTPDYLDLDSDGDGLPDETSDRTIDTDRDLVPDFRDPDDDGDGISDHTELGEDPSHPLDTDGDGTPDHHDLDSDGDGVSDHDSGSSADTDGDGVLDYRDDDADGDGILDTSELGGDATKPRDTDADGTPDYLDADSDGDGLHDGLEDSNGNGELDPGESDPLQADTDGDGADDLVESAAGTAPDDGAVNPQSEGNFVFVVPYQQPPSPPDATLDFATDLVRADVVFSLDTTGSMGEELAQLQNDLRSTIIPALAADIPDLGFGVADFEDFPLDPFGSPGDLPIRLVTPITDDPAVAQAGLDELVIGSGGDGPEAGAEALYQLSTGAGVQWPGGAVPAFDVGWRTGALPIIVQITDASMNSAETYGSVVPQAASLMQMKDALLARGVRVLAVVSAGGENPQRANEQYLDLVTTTGAVVPPDAFGSSGQCATGMGGSAVAPDASGNCPLLFGIDSVGAGLGNSIVDAVRALTKYALLDIDARAENEPGNQDANGDELDAVGAFLDRVVPNANPATATGCVEGLAVEDRLANDGVDDTFVGVPPGARVCFDVVAKQNDSVEPQLYPQLFRARIDLTGDGVTKLDSRQVWFLVPPKPPEPGMPCGGLDVDCAHQQRK